MSFTTPVLWAMIDANGHMRHSAYADLCAQARVAELAQVGITFDLFKELHIGPVLFREESIYLREIGMNDTVTTTTVLTRSRKDGSRFSFRHEIFRGDGVKAAELNLDGAWLDLNKRKLTIPPEDFIAKLNNLPRAEDYVEE